MHTHYYTSSTTLKNTFDMDHASHEIFPSIFNLTLFCILHSSTPQCPHLQIFCASLDICHALLLQNCLRIKSVLTSSSSHAVVNLPTPNYHPSTFDTICNMLTGYTIFSRFPATHFLAMTLVFTQ